MGSDQLNMAQVIPIRLPGPTHRIAIVGRTGSGKTQAAVWHLSNADFDRRPWVIVDYKDDDLINSIERAQVIGYDEMPDVPGIYILKVLPGEEKQLSDWFQDAWSMEDIGIYIDEGYMVDRNDRWFNACLTQGRSRHIPMIVLSQRPVWLSRFVFSEADFFQVFDLTHKKDLEKVREYIRDDENLMDRNLEQYHSFYYDVGQRRLEIFRPVPEEDVLLARIERRLAELKAVEEATPRRRAM